MSERGLRYGTVWNYREWYGMRYQRAQWDVAEGSIGEGDDVEGKGNHERDAREEARSDNHALDPLLAAVASIVATTCCGHRPIKRKQIWKKILIYWCQSHVNFFLKKNIKEPVFFWGGEVDLHNQQ